ncbi:MAG TPA: helix-turn-helix transcriptional regulator [Tepidisphaeraceae bacterium]|nr:helix-turn-helix transcriptional regulator [Tepidisphaeraceae bacterium]
MRDKIHKRNRLGQQVDDQRLHQQREMVAGFCRLLSENLLAGKDARKSPVQGIAPISPMSPRVTQTLEFLLAGDSEKQIAAKLGLSQHTIHDYVKRVYRHFAVSTRAELLALWVRK